MRGFCYQDTPLNLLTANDYVSGNLLLENNPDAAVALIDVVMDDKDSGLKLVKKIRKSRPEINMQIVIRTGQPGETPEREILTNYEISDYLHKSELDANILKHRLISYLRAFSNLQELAKQRDAYKKILQQKDKILSVVSHELRGPLNNISGLLQLLSFDDDNLSPEQKEYLHIMTACTNGMIYQVSDLLDSSAFDRGSLKIEQRPIGTNEYMANIAPILKLQHQLVAREKNIQLIIEAEDNLPAINIDESRLNQVIVNLITNAFKYTEAGSVTLRAAAEGNTVTLSVIDTGIGIQAWQLPTIFEEYSQVSAGNAYKNGIGMGLSIVKTLVDLHGGKLSVSSEFGEGSEFKVALQSHSLP